MPRGSPCRRLSSTTGPPHLGIDLKIVQGVSVRQGLRSQHANTVACLTIGLSVASWVTSKRVEPAGIDRADRWGIFVATWPATWFGLGQALAEYERNPALA
ncbi:hypothetical protein ACFWA4_15965 [Streptomyces sp. NPDC060011]|uniref:hypothetical protein n=1 Tax=Streptomyces sp. NPDC060011 TaxID=3347037 RepID=UPI0036952EF5